LSLGIDVKYGIGTSTLIKLLSIIIHGATLACIILTLRENLQESNDHVDPSSALTVNSGNRTEQAPDGWFPDPDGKPAERYWDGQNWTDQTRPMGYSRIQGNIATAQRDGIQRSKTVAILLCIFFGWLGVHRFYVGKTGSGVAMLLTGGGCGIWALVDLIMIITGDFKDINNQALI